MTYHLLFCCQLTKSNHFSSITESLSTAGSLLLQANSRQPKRKKTLEEYAHANIQLTLSH